MHAAASLLAGRMDVPHPELVQITLEEATDLARALNEVALLHDLSINPKLAAYGNLIAVCGIVYGGRVLAYRAIVNHERHRAPAPIAGVSMPADAELMTAVLQ